MRAEDAEPLKDCGCGMLLSSAVGSLHDVPISTGTVTVKATVSIVTVTVSIVTVTVLIVTVTVSIVTVTV